jgi:hypothetical protein
MQAQGTQANGPSENPTCLKQGTARGVRPRRPEEPTKPREIGSSQSQSVQQKPDANENPDAKETLGDLIKTAGLLAKRFGGQHEVVPAQEVDGKIFWIARILDEDGSRCTLNFYKQWNQGETRQFDIFFLNCKDALAYMAVQLKHDKPHRPDPDRSGILHQGDSLQLTSGIGNDYFAERDFKTDELLRSCPDACILVVEHGLSFERVGARVIEMTAR